MKIVVAIDSFKGCLNTWEAGAAAADGIRRAYPNAVVTVCPLADGGEGTVDAIVSAARGEFRDVTVTGPAGTPVLARYGILPETRTAVMEMSAAAGITLVSEAERNPMLTTTYGVGQMIAHAVEQEGCRHFVMGIGGSATNDGGVGMLQALGFSFLDREGKSIPVGGGGLSALAEIRTDGALPQLFECDFTIACDVQNPLCGAAGCSAIYGPQKGATSEMIREMDGWLGRYAALTAQVTGISAAEVPGAGAAGGMGFAFLSYLGGKLRSGIETVMETIGLEQALWDADLVITGEGRLDGQSCMGKAPVGVARLAKKYDKPVLALSGCVTEDAHVCNAHGIDAFFPILQAPCTLAEAMDKARAADNLARTAEQAMRLFCAGRV